MRARLLVVVSAALLLGGCAGGPTADPAGTDAPTPAATSPGATASVASEPAAPTVPPLHPSVDGYPETVLTLSGPEVAAERVAVKVADTAGRRQHGLMEVEHLPDGVGMLFVFAEDHRGGFWMKDTLVPLSIAFVAADGDILEILDMDPCGQGEDCPSYDPGVTYRYALEVPQGWFGQVGVDDRWRIGDLPDGSD